MKILDEEINLYIPCVKQKTVTPEIKFNKETKYPEWKEKIFQPKIKAIDLYRGPSWDTYMEIYKTLSTKYKVNLFIISAGAGIIKSDTMITSYFCSFSNLPPRTEFFIKDPKNHFDIMDVDIKTNNNIIICSALYLKAIKHIIPKGSIVISGWGSTSKPEWEFFKSKSEMAEILKASKITFLPLFAQFIINKIVDGYGTREIRDIINSIEGKKIKH